MTEQLILAHSTWNPHADFMVVMLHKCIVSGMLGILPLKVYMQEWVVSDLRPLLIQHHLLRHMAIFLARKALCLVWEVEVVRAARTSLVYQIST